VAKGSAPVPESSGIDWSTFGAGAAPASRCSSALALFSA
jgi:hypothetical protein